MSRPVTKAEILTAIHTEHELLEKKFAPLTAEEMVIPGSMDDWSVKDILAHLVDWEQRFIGWYQAGLRGEVPQTPAPGMNWRDLPKLNQQGYEKHRDQPLEEVLVEFHASYRQTLHLVESLSEDEIFDPHRYAWTGKYGLYGFIEGNTFKHYQWARTQVRTQKIKAAKRKSRA